MRTQDAPNVQRSGQHRNKAHYAASRKPNYSTLLAGCGVDPDRIGTTSPGAVHMTLECRMQGTMCHILHGTRLRFITKRCTGRASETARMTLVHRRFA